MCSVCFKVLNTRSVARVFKEICRTTKPTLCANILWRKTLTKLPRIVKKMWENLMIQCDYKTVVVENWSTLILDRHDSSCGYLRTRCTNAGWAEVINRHQKERHEHQLCQFRKIVCQDCGEQLIWKSRRLHPCFMQKQIDDLVRRLNVVQNDVGGIKHEVKLTQEEMAYLTREATERCNLFTDRQKIFVCGGCSDDNTLLNSVDSYTWPDNSWALEPAMNEKRSNPSVFVHDREIYVGGGFTGAKFTDSIEILNVEEENLEWEPQTPQFKMPVQCDGGTRWFVTRTMRFRLADVPTTSGRYVGR